jgi:hypothetical protein
MARRGGISSLCVSNGTTSVVACICTAMAERMMSVRNGTRRFANPASATRGSTSGSSCASAVTSSGRAMARELMEALKSACLESKWRRMAAGVTPSALAMSARVVAAKPRALKAARAASRICSREILGGRPMR